MIRRFVRRMLRKHRHNQHQTANNGRVVGEKTALSSSSSSSPATAAVSSAQSDPEIEKVLLYTTDFTAEPMSEPTRKSGVHKSQPNLQARMRVISCPSVHVSDIFKSLLCQVPRSDEIFQALAQYGDSIQATSVKFLLNERDYDDCSLIRKEYSKYQGSALCAYYDRVLTEKQWEQIFLIQAATTNNNQPAAASNFLSLFHISDFITVASGRKVAFIDPSERISEDGRSFVALFDLDDDSEEVRILADQFRPIFDAPLISMPGGTRGGTMIRLPLRCCQHKLGKQFVYQCQRCSRRGRSSDPSFMSAQILTPARIVDQAQSFANEYARPTLLFSRNLTTISFFRSSDGRIFQQMFSMNLEFPETNQKPLMHKLIDGAVSNSDLPVSYATKLKFTHEHQNLTESQSWTLASFALAQHQQPTEPFVLKLAFPISPIEPGIEPKLKYLISTHVQHSAVRYFRMCADQRLFALQLDFSTNQQLLNQFAKSSLPEALAAVQFDQAYSLCLRQLTNELDTSSIWALMPAITDLEGFAVELWTKLLEHELFFSQSDGWGYVSREDMILNPVGEENPALQSTLTKLLASMNAPVVQPPNKHVLNALLSPKLTKCQTASPALVSEILRNSTNISISPISPLESLNSHQKHTVLEYLLKDGQSPLGLCLLPLANGQFIEFNPDSEAVYLCENGFRDQLFAHIKHRFVSTEITDELIAMLAEIEGTQIKPMPGDSTKSEFADMVMIPKEWRRGEEVVRWSKQHDQFNLLWLENLWKYIRDKMPRDLSPIENLNLFYVTNPREQYLSLYIVSRESTLLYCSKEHLLDPMFASMQRVLLKLGVQVVDNFPELIVHHPDFDRYVHPFNSTGVLRAIGNKIRRSCSKKYLSQSFNNELSPKEMATVRSFFCKHFPPAMNEPEIELLRTLPIFVDAATGSDLVECREKFLAIDEAFHCYSSGPRCPAFLKSNCSKPIIFAQDQDSRILVERLGHRIVDFNTIARHVIALSAKAASTEDRAIVSGLGKWLLSHCAGLILTDSTCQEVLSKARLFPNRKLELCSPLELIDPTFRERFASVLSTRLLPSIELSTERNISLLKMMKLRTIYDVTADELVEACELSRTFTSDRRRTLANLLVDVLTISDRLFDEHSTRLSTLFKTFLHTFPWVPLLQHHPSGYPNSLVWMTELKKSAQFVPVPECVDRSLAMIVGSVAQVSELDIQKLTNTNQQSKFAFVRPSCSMVVRHLKNVVECFQAVSSSSQDRNQYFDYMNLTKKCYDFLFGAFEPQLIVSELTAAGVERWIWNGRSGFSSVSEILNHSVPELSPYFFTIPSELQCFAKFFEACGVSTIPQTRAILRLLNSTQSYYPPVRSNQKLIQWIRENYSDRRIQQMLLTPAAVEETPQNPQNQMRIWIPGSFDVGSNREMLRSAILSVRPDKEVWIGVGNTLAGHSDDDWSHYRFYEQLVLPNLGGFSRNIRDALVLLALDNCDVTMMNILREHQCIPATPNGSKLRIPRELIDPRSSKLSFLFSADEDELFPYGNKETYLRQDRLEVLRLLGMRTEQIEWAELVERAEKVNNPETAIALLEIMAQKLSETEDSAEISASKSALANQKFVPLKPKPISYPIAWAGDRSANKANNNQLTKPRDLIEPSHELLAGSSFAVIDSERLSSIVSAHQRRILYKFLDVHEPSLSDVLNQLKEVITSVNAAAPVCELPDKTAIELQPILRACYSFIYQQSQFPDFNHAIMRDFFGRNAILLVGTNLYSSGRIFSEIEYSVVPYVISACSASALPSGFVNDILKIRQRPDLSFVREAIAKGNVDANDAVRMINLLANSPPQKPTHDFPIPLADNRIVSLNKLNGSERLHPFLDPKILQSLDPKLISSQHPHHQLLPGSMVLKINVQDEMLKALLTSKISENTKLSSSMDLRLINDREPERILELLLVDNKLPLTQPTAQSVLNFFERSLATATSPVSFTRIRELGLFGCLFAHHQLTNLANSTNNSKRIFVLNQQTESLIERIFQTNPFPESITLLRAQHLAHPRLNQHLRFIELCDPEAFVQLIMPFLGLLPASPGQLEAIKFLRDSVFPKLTGLEERNRLYELVSANLSLRNRRDQNVLAKSMYDPSVCDLKPPLIDPQNELPHPDLRPVYNFLPLRKVLEPSRLRNIMKSIEQDVVSQKHWSLVTREKSRLLCEHIQNHLQQLEDKTVLDLPFLEPQMYDNPICKIVGCFEQTEMAKEPVVLSLKQGVIDKFMPLVWSSSFVLPKCVDGDILRAIPTAELNALMVRVDPPINLVVKNLTNIADALVKLSRPKNGASKTLEEHLVPILDRSYQYLIDKMAESGNEQFDELKLKPLIYTHPTHQLVPANRICVNLKAEQEIPPFLYSIPPSLIDKKDLFTKLGASSTPTPQIFADILAQMARVCRNDFLNPNEIKKAVKAMAGLFCALEHSPQNQTTPHHRFTGLFLLANDLKMHRASDVVVVDTRSKLDYVRKLGEDLFLFNPSECVLRLSGSSAISAIDRISPNQRPQLFSEKYQESFSLAVPEDRDGKRQQILHAIERKYAQLLQSRTLHRCLGRALSDQLARQNSSVCVTIDQMELYLRTRFSILRLVCVEHLETSLVLRSSQQRIESTIDEKACYLASSEGDLTLYMSSRHAEQPYFPACLSKAIVPILEEVKAEAFVLCGLLSTSISHMSRTLDLFGVTPEEAIMSTLKLHYIPGPGRIYADDLALLSEYDPSVHRLIPGDLCVLLKRPELYVYCTFVEHQRDEFSGEIVRIGVLASTTNFDDSSSVEQQQPPVEFVAINEFFVLENWSRVHDAAYAQPLDDQEEIASRSSQGNSNSDAGSMTDEERAELDATRALIDSELREVYFACKSNGDDRKRKMRRMLLKWHPDKNQGKERFASEVFKYLRKQIDAFDVGGGEVPLNPYSWMSNSFCSADSSSKFGGSYDNLHNPPPPNRDSTQSTTNVDDSSANRRRFPRTSPSSHHSGSVSPPGRSNSFRTAREEWQWKRQHGFTRRAGFFNDSAPPPPKTPGDFGSRKPWTNGVPKSANASAEAKRWFRQASCDLRAAANDMVPSSSSSAENAAAYEWVCYKCYRAAEKALKALHLTKSAGTMPATDLPTLLYGVEDDIRVTGYNLYRWLGDANRMQYPNAARISKTPNEIFTQTQAERALESTKELLDRIEAIVLGEKND